MLKQLVRRAWEALRSRYSETQIILFAGFATLILAAALVGLITNAVKVNEYTELVTKAQTSIENEDYTAAQKLTERAEKVEIADKSMVSWLQVRINEGLASKEAYKKGLAYLRKDDLFEAYSNFSKVKETSKSNFEAAQTKMALIRTKALAEGLQVAKRYADQKKYDLAISTLSSLQTIFNADNPQIVTALTKYRTLETAKMQADRARALSSMSKKVDEFNGMVWYQDRSSPRYRNSNGFYLYFGTSGEIAQPLRLVVSYYDDSWLFIESARINVDGKIFALGATSWERDNNSSIWEWSDEQLSDREMIEAIIKSKSAVIRFDGSKYYDTRTISSTQKTALRNVLYAYDTY